MSTVADLEKQLADAKAKEQLASENKEIADLVKNYVGKCFGTRTFTQKSKSAWNKAIRIISIERDTTSKHCYGNDAIVMTYNSISYNKNSNWKDKSAKDCNYSRGIYSTRLNDGKYNMGHHIFNLITRMVEIPVETFQLLYECGEKIETEIEKTFSGKIDISVSKTMGDSGDQAGLEKAYQKMGVEYIDLEKYPELLYVLRYSHLPFMFEDRYLIRQYAKQSLEYQIKLLQNNYIGSRQDEINIIQSHIDLLKSWF